MKRVPFGTGGSSGIRISGGGRGTRESEGRVSSWANHNGAIQTITAAASAVDSRFYCRAIIAVFSLQFVQLPRSILCCPPSPLPLSVSSSCVRFHSGHSLRVAYANTPHSALCLVTHQSIPHFDFLAEEPHGNNNIGITPWIISSRIRHHSHAAPLAALVTFASR